MSGHSAAHMSSMRSEPATAEIRRPTPSITATPTPSRQSMNSQSVATPAVEANVSLSGPMAANFMKPWLGVPPLIHAAAGVPSATGAPRAVVQTERLVEERPQEDESRGEPGDGEPAAARRGADD